MPNRRVTKPIYVGNVKVGGDANIAVQSMTKTDTRDVKATVDQIKGLEEVGCEIIRVAVPDMGGGEGYPPRSKSRSISPSWPTSTSTTNSPWKPSRAAWICSGSILVTSEILKRSRRL